MNMLERMKNMISNYTLQECEQSFLNHILNARFYINDIYNIQYMKNWELPSRTTINYRLMWVRQGSGYFHFEDRKIPLEKGRLIIYSPKLKHYSTQGDITPILYSISFNMKEPVNHPKPFYISYIPEQHNFYQSVLENLTKTFKKEPSELDKNIHHVTLQNLLLHIYKDLSTVDDEPVMDHRITVVKDYLKRRVTDMPTISELCQLTGLSQAYFSRLFKEQIGVTPKHYMYQLKMEHSKYLLSQLGYTVKETAITLGYSDPYIFSNQFKRTYGYSPSVLSRHT